MLLLLGGGVALASLGPFLAELTAQPVYSAEAAAHPVYAAELTARPTYSAEVAAHL